MTVAAFARFQGVSRQAVQKRIREGAIPSAKLEKGRWVIVDPEKARREWEAHTTVRIDAERPKEPENGAEPDRMTSPLAQATLRERNARADHFELENLRSSRAVVPLHEAEIRATTIAVAARTKMLGLPSRAKQRLPHLTAADLAVLDALVREALEEIADGG